MQDGKIDRSSSRPTTHPAMQPLHKDVRQQNESVWYSQAGQVDAGRHLAHARRAEDSERDGVADDADEDDERRDVSVDVLSAVEELKVRLYIFIYLS